MMQKFLSSFVRWHAFKGSPPPDHYRILLMDFFEYMNGLPLAVRVLGSYLNGKPLNLWKVALENLKRILEGHEFDDAIVILDLFEPSDF